VLCIYVNRFLRIRPADEIAPTAAKRKMKYESVSAACYSTLWHCSVYPSFFFETPRRSSKYNALPPQHRASPTLLLTVLRVEASFLVYLVQLPPILASAKASVIAIAAVTLGTGSSAPLCADIREFCSQLPRYLRTFGIRPLFPL